jgi:hypothetical protein
MPTINITITDADQQALEFVAADATDWINFLVENRINKATNQIVAIYTEKALAEGVQIPTTKAEIVADAYTRGWVVAASTEAEAV